MKKNPRSRRCLNRKGKQCLLPIAGLVLVLAFITAALTQGNARTDLPLPQASDRAF